MLLSSPAPRLLRRAASLSNPRSSPLPVAPVRRQALSSMPPKRKVAAKAEATDAPKKAKAAKGLAVGEQFPDIGPLETDEGKMVDLKDVLAKTGVLLFSYPKANTSGCTTQANGHNDQLAAYKAKGFAVYGISADKPATQANWRSKYSLAYNLLCDPDFAVLKQLDWVKDGGAAVKRSHAVIEKGGKVLDLHTPVTPKDSVALGLEFIEGL